MSILVAESPSPAHRFRPSTVDFEFPTNDRVDRWIEAKANAMLQNHPHFRGQRMPIKCCCQAKRVVLRGDLPSYFLKQMAQECVRSVEGAEHLENKIQVVDSLSFQNRLPE